MARRYDRASKVGKGAMLDELCALTGWTRRHARRALRETIDGAGTRARKRPGRPRVYGAEILAPLRRIWATLDGPSGKRLALSHRKTHRTPPPGPGGPGEACGP